MAKESSLDHFGGSSQPQVARVTNGGQQTPVPTSYCPPQGPTSQMQQGPGLHGTNHGNSVMQGKH